jgi:spoIIIJ-associated protein
MSVKFSVEDHGRQIDAFLAAIIDRGRFELRFEITSGVDVHPDFESPDLLVRFSGDDVDLLLANKAELLLALEHLTQETLRVQADDHSRICFDANDYRLMRIQELRLSAQTAAERVKASGQPFFFSPMTSRERRILHMALRDEKTLRSESVGTGAYRQVCVLPVDAPLPPAPAPPRRFGPPRSDGPRSDRGDRRPFGGNRAGGNRGDGNRGPGRGPRDRRQP